MKNVLLALLICGIGASLTSCAHLNRRSSSHRSHTYAIAVTVSGGLQPTPGQWATIQAAVAKQFDPLGYTLVTDLSLADRILRIDFEPDPSDPENKGYATILGWRDNPRTLVASRSHGPYRYPGGYGFAGMFGGASWAAWNGIGFDYPFFGYAHSYHSGYTYTSTPAPSAKPVPPSTTTPTTPAPTHPHHRHPPAVCLPDPQRTLPFSNRYAVYSATAPSTDTSMAVTRERGSWRSGDGTSSSSGHRSYTSDTDRSSTSSGTSSGGGGGRTYSRTDSTSTRSTPSASRSDSGKSSSGGWWRSGSSSGSSSGSGSSHSSSSGSSGSYSSGSSHSSGSSSSTSSGSSYSSGSSSSSSSGSSYSGGSSSSSSGEGSSGSSRTQPN